MGSFAGKPSSTVVEVVIPAKGNSGDATGGTSSQSAKPVTSPERPPKARHASVSFRPMVHDATHEDRLAATSAEALVRSHQQTRDKPSTDAFHVNSRLLEPSRDELHIALGQAVLSEAEEDEELQVAIAASLHSAPGTHKAGELRRLPRPRMRALDESAGSLNDKDKEVSSSPNSKAARRPPLPGAQPEAASSSGARPSAMNGMGGNHWGDNSDFTGSAAQANQVRPPASSRSASCGPRPGGAMRSGIVSLPRIHQTLPASQQEMVKDLHEQIQGSGAERATSYVEQRAKRGAVDRAAERVLKDLKAQNCGGAARGDSAERVDVQALLEGMDLDLPTATKGVSGKAGKQDSNFNDRFASSAVVDNNNRSSTVKRVQKPMF